MMSFDSKGGTFPFTINEMDLLQGLLTEKVAEMEQDLKNKNSHVYVNACMLMSKTYAYINLMKHGEED